MLTFLRICPKTRHHQRYIEWQTKLNNEVFLPLPSQLGASTTKAFISLASWTNPPDLVFMLVSTEGDSTFTVYIKAGTERM